MSVAAYVRVSSRAQDFDTQRSTIERAVKERGEVVTEWYREKRSGKRLARPELDRLRANVRTGIVRRVYAFKLDRFTRSGVADTFAFAAEVTGAGCEVLCVMDNLHLRPGKDDITTEVLLFALGLAAKIERTSINERISEARSRLQAEGRPWGRPSRIAPETLAKMRSMREAGRSIRQVSVAVKVPRATVARALAPSRKDPPSGGPSDPRNGAAQPGAST